jgi:hypothetical protein
MRRLVVEFNDRLGLGPHAEALTKSRLIHQQPSKRGLRVLIQASFRNEVVLEDALLMLRRSHAAALRARLAEHEVLLTFDVVHPMFKSDTFEQEVLLLDLVLGIDDEVRATCGVPPFRLTPFLDDVARLGVRTLVHTAMEPLDIPAVDHIEDERVLRMAWSMGYFDQPKGAGLEAIAARERKSTTAVRRKIVRGVERLLRQRYGQRVD